MRSVNPDVLRQFVRSEIPSLPTDEPWTPAQFRAIAGIYLSYQQEREWQCFRLCGTAVQSFWDQCEACGRSYGPLEPVDWDCVGA